MDDKKYTEILLTALPRGGFVVQEADFSNSGSYRPQLAAFTTLSEALLWLDKNMKDIANEIPF